MVGDRNNNRDNRGTLATLRDNFFGRRQANATARDLQSELEEYIAKYESVKTEHNMLLAAHRKLKFEYGDLRGSLADCKKANKSLQEEKYALFRVNDDHEETTKQLQRQLKESNSKYDQLHKTAQANIDAKTLQQKQQQEQLRGLGNLNQELQRTCQEAQTQAKTLQEQLLLFKKNAAASAKVTNQLGDDEIRQKFDNIYYALQDFAVRMLRRTRADTIKLSDEAKVWLASHLFDSGNAPTKCVPHLMLSIFSRILTHLFEPDNHFGLPGEAVGAAAKDLATKLRAADTPNSKAWLDLTRKMLFEINEKALQDADMTLIEAAIYDAFDMLKSAVVIDWETEKPTLRKIFASAIELYRELHRSKATFKLLMAPCHSGQGSNAFEISTMAAVASDENEHALVARPLEVSVFPGIYKYGNEMGQKQDQMTVICRARVVPRKIKRKQAQSDERPAKKVCIKQEPE